MNARARWALIALIAVFLGGRALVAVDERRRELAAHAELILKLQTHRRSEARVSAAGMLGGARWTDGSEVSALAKALVEDPDSRVRAECAWALHRLGSRASSAIPALCEAENDEDREVRKSASSALASIRDAMRDGR